MSDENKLVLGGIHFGPSPSVTDKVRVKAEPIKISASAPLVISCLVSECPNNKGNVCMSPRTIRIGLNGKCLFGDDARHHAWDQRKKERQDASGTP